MTATVPIAGAVWAAVDRLTQPRHVSLVRDDGTTVAAQMGSLWDQACDALAQGSEGAGQVRWGSQAERSPADLDLMQVHGDIRHMTLNALVERRQVPRPGKALPAHLRQLASYLVTHEPGVLPLWEYRISQWGRVLEHYLRLTTRMPGAVRLRNSACPACGTRQVVVDQGDGPVVAPALVVVFRDGLVRMTTCSQCGAAWGRGEQMLDLATLLGVA